MIEPHRPARVVVAFARKCRVAEAFLRFEPGKVWSQSFLEEAIRFQLHVRFNFTREIFVRSLGCHRDLLGLTFDPSVGMLGSNVYTKARRR